MGTPQPPKNLKQTLNFDPFDLLGQRRAADAAKHQQEALAQQQSDQASRQAAALKAEAIKPRVVDPQDPSFAASEAARRYRAGFVSTIRTSPLGLTTPAYTSAAGLTPGKSKLGQ